VAIQLPAMFILTSYIGVDGVLWSGPVSDFISFILTILVLFIVCKKIFNKRQTS
jgi:Na+-driven multidrug efflux pump